MNKYKSFKTLLGLTVLALYFSGLLLSCGDGKDAKTVEDHGNKDVKIDQPGEWVKNATLYEVNLRHYSEKGDIASFIPHLARLKKLGVNVLWFMPIQPIGIIKRKAKGDVFTSEVPLNERYKYLGSPYSIKDYSAVNPDYGTLADFKHLVDTCHALGFKVVLDWVANHTSWDNEWLINHPDWYTQVDGKITDPLTTEGKSMGWTDVADLNYDNSEMRTAMTDALKFWVEECDIDGYRCDVAFEVPADFWDAAFKEVEKVKPMFLLAEAEGHNLKLYDSTFSFFYSWDLHHQLNQVAKGEATAEDIVQVLHKYDTMFGNNALPMTFITNHDENSWNGTVFERMPNSWKSMAVFTFALKGLPLIHTGQEVGLNHRLAFFEKDEVNWQKDSADYFTSFYTQLTDLKKHEDLSTVSPMTFKLDGNIMLVERGSHLFAFNFTNEEQNVTFNTNANVLMSDGFERKVMNPWGFVVLRK